MNDDAFHFEGQVVVVTGAGNGLGRDYARYFASKGAAVVVNDYGTHVSGSGHSTEPADRVVEEIEAMGGLAAANHDGVHLRAGADAIIRTAIDSFGRVDAVVCNAGIWSCQPFEETSDEIWERTIGVHLNGSMYVARAAWPHFLEQRYGRLILTSSSGGLYGKAGLTAYGAAKAGVFGLMRSLALEVEATDIRVNLVLPGAATRMISRTSATLWESRPGLADPGHVVPMVAYLASRGCRANGHAYSAGGGYFARDEAMQGPGVRLPYDAPISVEQVAALWEGIDDMSHPTRFRDVMAYGARMFDLD